MSRIPRIDKTQDCMGLVGRLCAWLYDGMASLPARLRCRRRKPVPTAAEAEVSDPLTLFVNGRRRQVRAAELSYADLVELAFGKPLPRTGVIFTISYERAAGPSTAGCLGLGQHVQVADGMIVNVALT